MASVFFALLAAVLFLLEQRLARSWSAGYFTRGVVVFRARCLALHPRASFPRPETLELRFMDSQWPEFIFKVVGSGRMLFAEDYRDAKLVYTQLMRGSLVFDAPSRTVQVVGRLNYFAFAFVVAVLAGAASLPNWQGFVIALAGMSVIAACYFVQAKRYDEVLSAAAAEWGEAHATSAHNDG